MYTRKRYTTLLIRYGEQIAIDLYQKHASQFDIEVISPPTEGVVMIKMRETAEQSLFYMGEVTVFETKLRVNEHIGLGVVHGQKALSEALAFIDACYQSHLLIDEIDTILRDLEIVEQQKIKEKSAKIMKTKVDFETMDV